VELSAFFLFASFFLEEVIQTPRSAARTNPGHVQLCPKREAVGEQGDSGYVFGADGALAGLSHLTTR
jgi:hypothetical protein